MKIVKSILVYIGLVIASLIAIVFGFLQIRSLFAGDYSLMNNSTISFLGYLFRGLYFLSILALSIAIVVFRIKQKKICIILFMSSLALLVGAILSFIHFEYYVSLVVIFVCLILAIITLIGFFKKEEA